MTIQANFSSLSAQERKAARIAIEGMATRLPLDRIINICHALASGEVLIDFGEYGVPRGCSIVQDTKLTRADLVEAAALELRLRDAIGEDGAARTIAFLGEHGAATTALLAGSTFWHPRVSLALRRMEEGARQAN